MTRLAAAIALLAFWSAGLATAGEPEHQDSWFSLVAGRFVLVGREPDSGAAYAGSAEITPIGNAFSLERTIGVRRVIARGAIEVPSPPGEGKVLRFRWKENDEHLMTCLVQSDLDNYARLTCHWVLEGKGHDAPGLEAYFSTEAWPENAPSTPLHSTPDSSRSPPSGAGEGRR
jgi:hypothetical protein